MADDNDDDVITCLDTHSDDEVYETTKTTFISPALHEELLRTRLNYANRPIHAKTLPARHRRSGDSDSERGSRRYSASRVDGIILNSLLEAKPDEVDAKTLPRKSIRHLQGKLSFKKKLWLLIGFNCLPLKT